MFLNDPLYTMAYAYEQIQAGEEPWVELGDFMNEWFVYSVERRAELVAEAPDLPEKPTSEEYRWACFIAASVEYLCQTYAIPCPSWVHEKSYQLEEPWYDVIYLHDDARARLERTTPEPFKRRNIFCGDRVYLDKNEVLSRPA